MGKPTGARGGGLPEGRGSGWEGEWAKSNWKGKQEGRRQCGNRGWDGPEPGGWGWQTGMRNWVETGWVGERAAGGRVETVGIC